MSDQDAAVRPVVPHLRLPGSLILAVLLGLAGGCASPGPPRPPSLNLANPVSDLSAQRVGTGVLLHWTTPSQTTDGLDLAGPFAARICRELLPQTLPGPLKQAAQPSAHSSCIQTQELRVGPGPNTLLDPLPSSLSVDPPRLLAYRVELLNRSGRSAGLSPPAYAAAGAAPPGVAGLRATASPSGAVIEWQNDPAPNAVELDRKKDSPPASPTPSPRRLQLGAAQPAEVHLRPAPQAASQRSASIAGTLDPGAHPGESYSYSATRITLLNLQGHPLEIRSLPSPVVFLAIKDIFPPHSPTGLRSVANLPGPSGSSIDLSWEPNAEPDLAGYLVYRRFVEPGAPPASLQLLTSSPVAIPAFHDSAVEPGHVYAYSVTAVDASGNESPPGSEVQEHASAP